MSKNNSKPKTLTITGQAHAKHKDGCVYAVINVMNNFLEIQMFKIQTQALYIDA